jgi:ribonuclease BN (tRNA processing enzyme)
MTYLRGMSPRLTVLGSSGTYAAPGNSCSGYLLRHDGAAVLVDCGPGTLARLQEFVHPANLTAVVVSHEHPDHWLDLPVMRNALRYWLDGEGIPLYSTASTLSLAEELCHGDLEPTFAPQVITAEQELTIGPFRLRTSRTAHPPETLALRFDADGVSIAYSADTGPAWTFAELGAGIDLAVGEATVLAADAERVAGVHTTAAEAGAGARAAGVGKLVITHLRPGDDHDEFAAEAADAYGAAVQVATPGVTYHP